LRTASRQLARDLLRRYDLEAARSIADSALRSNCEDPWPYHVVLLEFERLQGRRETALQELNRLQRKSPPSTHDVESWIEIKRLVGYYSGLLGQYEIAHRWLNDAEFLAREGGKSEAQAEVHLCQAMISFLQQNYMESDRIFRIVLDLSKEIGGWYFRASALWGIGKNLMIQNFYVDAIPWLQESLSIFESARVDLSMALVWSELAVCHLGLGNDQLSLDLLKKAELVQQKAGTVANYQVVIANIGNVYMYRGDYTTAIDHYRRALSIAQEIKDPVSIRKWTYNINLAYLKLREQVDHPSLPS